VSFPWLTVLFLVPILGAVVVAALPTRASALAPKQISLGFSLVALAIAIGVAVGFDPSGGMQYNEVATWIPSFGAHYALGVDGIGLALVLMTAILSPVVILASWHHGVAEGGSGMAPARWAPKGFFAWMLALEGLALGVFEATDVFLFYIFFEATLIPIWFLVSGWGGPDRARAGLKFLIYSLIGGFVLLIGVIGLYVYSSQQPGGPTYLVSELSKMHFGTTAERWMFITFFVAFAIKAPMFPVHTWLPDTTEQATPGTSVLLVSVLDKIGTFGMIRFCLEIFPGASRWATPVIVVLAIVSILYGGLMAIGSDNIYRLIAYTSVSHFGFIVLGIFVLNSQGLSGANLYMINHGFSTAALFLVAGFLISRRGSALISDYGGVEKVAPVLAGLFLLAGLSTLSLPGLAPFVSEILVLIGAFVHSAWAAAFAVIGIVLAAFYVLLMYQRIFTGPSREGLPLIPDLNLRELVALAPLVLLLVVLGFYPRPLLSWLDPTTQHTMSLVGVHDPAPTVNQAEEAHQ
jgi:NADH-quinone oxidoreductase subunit M